MSRIGKLPVEIPKGVDVSVSDAGVVDIKGPKGQLEINTHGRVSVSLKDSMLHIARPDDSKESRAFHGLYQRLIRNMVLGVHQGFKKE